MRKLNYGEFSILQMYNLLFNSVSEASKIILKARWRYQKHSTKFGGYIGKKIWIVRHLEMKNWRKMTKNNAFKNEKLLLEVLKKVRTVWIMWIQKFWKKSKNRFKYAFLRLKNIQNHSSNIGEYVGKQIEIMRHIEM